MFERHPDQLDNATNITEADRRSREMTQREKAKPKQARNLDGTWPTPDCEECGEPIGELRLEATGATTCIHCATALEQKGKQYAKR